MEMNSINRIKWETILGIPEFVNVLNISTLKELTLLSKSFRSKLQSKLFESIQLHGRRFSSYLNNSENDLICEYINFRYLSSIPTCLGNAELFMRFNFDLYRDLDMDKTVKEIELKLAKFSYHTKSFELDFLDCVGYYMLPILNIFPNLTTLKLEYSTVSLDKFTELLQSLTNLNCLRISNLYFAVSSNQEATLNNLKFPQKLESLIFFPSKFVKIAEHESVFKVLFKNLELESLALVTIPPIQITSLRKFNYIANTRDDNGLNKFLEINDQLEYLSLDSNFLDSKILELIRKSGKLKELTIRCEDEDHPNLNFTTLASITKLKFYSVPKKYLQNLETLCLSCPNLNSLNLIFGLISTGASLAVSTTITRIIPKLNYLFLFNLSTYGDYRSTINLTELNNVTRIKIHCNLDLLYFLDFANNEKLSKVEFYWDFGIFFDELDFKDVKTKFESYKDWRFIYGEWLIKGRRVNNGN